MATFISNSPEETGIIAGKFAISLTKGDVVALEGDLGAGKTCFTRGLVKGLGSPAEVTSPTFTLLHEYSGGRLPVYHFDFFRLVTESEAAALGLDDYLFSDGVCIIEWPDRFPGLIPGSARRVRIAGVDPTTRSIDLP